jgi:hypothetical protein
MKAFHSSLTLESFAVTRSLWNLNTLLFVPGWIVSL